MESQRPSTSTDDAPAYGIVCGASTDNMRQTTRYCRLQPIVVRNFDAPLRRAFSSERRSFAKRNKSTNGIYKWIGALAILSFCCTNTVNCAGELEFKLFQRLFTPIYASNRADGYATISGTALRQLCNIAGDCQLAICARQLNNENADVWGNNSSTCVLGYARAGFAFQRDAPAPNGAAAGETALTLHFNASWEGTFEFRIQIITAATGQVLAEKTFARADFLPITRNWTQLNASLALLADADDALTPPARLDLSIRVRAKCTRHYYGRHCAVHCNADADDDGARFDCVPETGIRRCRMGWRGALCDVRAERCMGVECAHGDCNPETGQCVCQSGYRGAKCDQCVTWAECKGRCTRPYECLCPQGRGGPNCDKDMLYCAHNSPCLNGGICANDRNGSYTCTCAPGFTGRNCEHRIESCNYAPCHNGAECITPSLKSSGFICKCPLGSYGRYCQSRARGCIDQPCANNASCFEPTLNAWTNLRVGREPIALSAPPFQCRCAKGWSGALCDTPSNWCAPDKCLNDGICVESANSALGYTCRCAPGFRGFHCEQNVEDCNGQSCHNNGTCVDDVDGFHCECPIGYSGPLCQYEDVNSKPRLPIGKYDLPQLTKNTGAANVSLSSSAISAVPSAKFMAGALIFVGIVLLLMVACICHLRVHLSAKISQTQQQEQQRIEASSLSSVASPVTTTSAMSAGMRATYELNIDALHDDIVARKRHLDVIETPDECIESDYGDIERKSDAMEYTLQHCSRSRSSRFCDGIRTAAVVAERRCAPCGHQARFLSTDSNCGHCCVAPPPSYAETVGDSSSKIIDSLPVQSRSNETEKQMPESHSGNMLEDFETLPINTSNPSNSWPVESFERQQHQTQHMRRPQNRRHMNCSRSPQRSATPHHHQRQQYHYSRQHMTEAPSPSTVLSYSNDSVIVDMVE